MSTSRVELSALAPAEHCQVMQYSPLDWRAVSPFRAVHQFGVKTNKKWHLHYLPSSLGVTEPGWQFCPSLPSALLLSFLANQIEMSTKSGTVMPNHYHPHQVVKVLAVDGEPILRDLLVPCTALS